MHHIARLREDVLVVHIRCTKDRVVIGFVEFGASAVNSADCGRIANAVTIRCEPDDRALKQLLVHTFTLSVVELPYCLCRATVTCSK